MAFQGSFFSRTITSTLTMNAGWNKISIKNTGASDVTVTGYTANGSTASNSVVIAASSSLTLAWQNGNAQAITIDATGTTAEVVAVSN